MPATCELPDLVVDARALDVFGDAMRDVDPIGCRLARLFAATSVLFGAGVALAIGTAAGGPLVWVAAAALTAATVPSERDPGGVAAAPRT